MEDKLSVWDKVCTTNPKYTKEFARAGGFKGTAQNPTYAIKKMTENFGVIGTWWGIGKPEFNVQNAGQTILVFCTVEAWVLIGEQKSYAYGVGGESVLSETKYGLKPDDEAFKKAYTDAAMNALKYFGVAADLHLGMFDDSKYVNDLKNNVFAEKKREAPEVEKKVDTPEEKAQKSADWAKAQETFIKETTDMKALDDWYAKTGAALQRLSTAYPALYKGLDAAYIAKRTVLFEIACVEQNKRLGVENA